jgi:membrane-bound lytic murein transglycosylase D
MTKRLRLFFFCLAVLLAGGYAGCTPAQNHQFRMAFMPPAPRGAVPPEVSPPEPPPLEPDYYSHETPILLDLTKDLPSRSSRMDLLIIRADERFRAGKKAYEAGDMDLARSEFDRAVNLLLGAPEGAKNRQDVERRLEELVDSIHRYDLAGLGAADVPDEPGFEKSPLDDIPELTFPIDPKFKDQVKEQLRATVSQLPLEVNEAVLAYIRFFASEQGHKIIVNGLRRFGRYKPVVTRILDEEGVPPELIYLAQAESGFEPRAVSRKAATGMWQFMQFRGREYDLMQTPYTDDRLDPEKATRAAARHLRDLYNEFGDWYLAMAAYNCGPAGVQKAVERTGYASFWELRDRNVLPRETANYVPIILAMTIVAKNPKAYGLESVDPDPPLVADVVELTAPTHLDLIADLVDAPVPQLRELNPALLKSIAPAGYSLRIPSGTGALLTSGLDKIPEANRIAWRAHRLGEGETMASVAQRFKVSSSAMAAANQMLDGDPDPGDLVIIPSAPRPEAAPRRTGVAKRSSIHHRTTTAAKPAAGAKVHLAPTPATPQKKAPALGYTASNTTSKKPQPAKQ